MLLQSVENVYEFANLKSLLYERVDKDKLNVIGGLFMQLRYTWFNSFVSKNLQWSTIHESLKLIGLPLKLLNKDEMNGIERLHIQLSYSLG